MPISTQYRLRLAVLAILEREITMKGLRRSQFPITNRMDNDKSYSDAMNEWARKNSFFGDRGNRLIHPNPGLPGPLRAFGYLLRVGSLLLILWLIVSFGLRKYVGGTGFGEKVGGVVASMVGAGDFEASALQWKGKRMTLSRFSAKGGDTAFFHTLEARYFRFDSSPLAFLGSEWNVGEVVLSNLAIKLRSGAKMSEVPVSLEMRGLFGSALQWGGYSGGTHDGKTLTFDSVKVLEAAIEWGLSEATNGALEGAGLVFVPDDSGWRLEIAGGKFRQNWLQGVTVEKLTIKPDAGKLRFTEGVVNLDNGGTATISGTVELGALPKLDLTIAITGGSLSDLLPENYTTYADGKVDGELRMTGSINTKSGVEFAGDLKISEGILRNIPVLESISILTETTRLRHLPITAGIVKFGTKEGVLNVQAFDLVSKDMAQLKGSFTFARDMSNASEAELIGLVTPTAGATPYLCDGSFRIGVMAASLAKTNEVGDKYFAPTSEGYRWMDVGLDGAVEQLTRPLYDEMLIDIRKLRDSR